MRYEIAARQVIGGRSYQEDAWRVRDHHGIDLDDEVRRPEGAVVPRAALVLVADGMGGHGGGEPASRLVADSFTAAFFKLPQDLSHPDRLDHALEAANRALAEAKQPGGQGHEAELNPRSGTTLVVGALLGHYLVFLSVGDSSIWRFRDGEVHRVNAAHERAADVDLRAAEIGTDEAWAYALGDESRPAITSAVMGDAVRQKQIDVRRIEHDDVLVFASDGIETLSLEHLRRAVPAFLARGGVGAVADALCEMARQTGGEAQDNTTVIAVRAVSDGAARPAEGEAERPAATARTAPIGPRPAPAAPGSEVPGERTAILHPSEPAREAPGQEPRQEPLHAPAHAEPHREPDRPAGPPAPSVRWLTGLIVAALACAAAFAAGWWLQLGPVPAGPGQAAREAQAPAGQAPSAGQASVAQPSAIPPPRPEPDKTGGASVGAGPASAGPQPSGRDEGRQEKSGQGR